MNEAVELRFSPIFLKRLKGLAKRYRQIETDIQPILTALQSGTFPGEQVTKTGYTIFKVRSKNSDIPIGKSGGYRIIYQVVSPQIVVLLLIYAKSDQSDVSVDEIVEAIQEGFG